MHSYRNRFFSFLLATLVSLPGLHGCGDSDSEPLAVIGETDVTDAEFAAYLRFKRMHLRAGEASSEALERYLQRGALAQAIEASGELDQQALAAELEEFRREMLISRYFEEHLRSVVTDEAITNYYNEHAAEYEDQKAHVAHILVRVNRRMTDEERRAARTKAQEAYSRIQAGEEFAAVARELSEDQVSASRGGDLGWVREGAIHPLFSERAFGTAVNAVTEVFETPFGFHVLKVLEEPQNIRRPIESVRGDIRYQLRTQAKEAEMARLQALVTFTVREGGFRIPEGAEESPPPADGEEEAEGSDATRPLPNSQRPTPRPSAPGAAEPGAPSADAPAAEDDAPAAPTEAAPSEPAAPAAPSAE